MSNLVATLRWPHDDQLRFIPPMIYQGSTLLPPPAFATLYDMKRMSAWMWLGVILLTLLLVSSLRSCFNRVVISASPPLHATGAASSSARNTGIERHTVPYFDALITKEPTHPSYDFVLPPGGVYLIELDYKTAPDPDAAFSLMTNMIWFVANNYPPKEILGMVFLNGEATSIIDGDSSLYYDPQTRKILTDKQRTNYAKTTSDLGDYSVSVEKRNVDGLIINLTFTVKTDLAQNPDAVVNIMQTRFVQEIKASSSKLGICTARAEDKTGQPIDGASLAFSPKDGGISRIWYKTNEHDFKAETLANIRDYR
jgi:hypothetical protein